MRVSATSGSRIDSKKPKKPSLLLMNLHIVMVNDACDSAHDPSLLVSQKEDHLRMGTKGMTGTEFLELVFDEGRDPIPVLPCKCPREPG